MILEITNKEMSRMIENGDIVLITDALFRGKNHAKDKLANSMLAKKLNKFPEGRAVLWFARGIHPPIEIQMPYKIDAKEMIGFFETFRKIESFDGSKIVPISYGYEIFKPHIDLVSPEFKQKIEKYVLLKRI